MKELKVFISQPMHGLTDDEIRNNRIEAVKRLEKIIDADKYIISVIDNFQFNQTKKKLEYIAYDILKMADADLVFFTKGWENYRGCKAEYYIATHYDMKILTE